MISAGQTAAETGASKFNKLTVDEFEMLLLALRMMAGLLIGGLCGELFGELWDRVLAVDDH